MSKILSLNLEDVRITQDYLIEDVVKKYLKAKEEEIPFVPIVKDLVTNKYSVLDEHHFLASKYLKKYQSSNFLLCESPKDLINIKEFPKWNPKIIQSRNDVIKFRFSQAQFYVPMINNKEIFTIEDLISHYF